MMIMTELTSEGDPLSGGKGVLAPGAGEAFLVEGVAEGRDHFSLHKLVAFCTSKRYIVKLQVKAKNVLFFLIGNFTCCFFHLSQIQIPGSEVILIAFSAIVF